MLEEVIKRDMLAAMKAKEPLKLSVLRMLVSELGYKKIDAQRDLTDEDVVSVVQKEAKKRREAIEAFGTAGRQEQVEKEQKELEILGAYLPVQMTEDEVRKEIRDLGELRGIGDFGKTMKVAMEKLRGKADGATVAKVVKEILGGNS